MANIVLFIGSTRKERQGAKVAKWVENKLKERGHSVSVIDPVEINLPLLQEMYKQMKNPSEKMQMLHDTIKNADGYVALTPEYNHSTSAALKNTLDHFLEEYYFKPSAIISYSAGPFGGIRAAEHLRQIFAELGSPSIPISMPIGSVQNVFDENGGLKDSAYDRRIERMMKEFEWYMNALKSQREKGTPY